MKRVRLDDVAFDAGTQIRAAISESVVADYAERMTDGNTFPPIVLFHDGSAYYLADGFHRFMAARRNDWREIDAEIHAGTKQDALWFALGANKENGQRLTDADTRHAITVAIRSFPETSMKQIAIQIGCSFSYVQRIKTDLITTDTLPNRVVGRDGKSYPATAAARSVENPKMAQIKELVASGASYDDVREAVGGASNSTITQARRELGISVGVDRSKAAVAQRRTDIRDMASRGFTTRQIAAAIGIGEQSVGEIARAEGVTIHADRVVGKTKRHDSTRIMERTVMDAENLTADVNLIDFSSLDREAFPRWIDSLIASQKSLAAFIRRLKQEQKNVEAA